MMNRRTFVAAAAAAGSVAHALPKLAVEGGRPVREKPLRAGYWGTQYYDDAERQAPLEHGKWPNGKSRIPPAFNNVGLEFLLKKFVSAADLPQVVRHQVWFGAFPPWRQSDILSDGALGALAEAYPGNDPLAEARAAIGGMRPRRPLDALLLTDFLMFLQDDLLTKVDRASMAASLEVRAPFLHHPLVEYVAGLPAEVKLRRFTSKYILKRAMGGCLTAEITSRRKRGFNIPLSRFMHGRLRPLLERAFEPARLERGGLLRPSAVRALVEEHLGHRHDHGRLLWNLLMLQLWHSRHFEGGDLLDAPADP